MDTVIPIKWPASPICPWIRQSKSGSKHNLQEVMGECATLKMSS